MKVDFRQVTPGGVELSYSASADDLDLMADGFDFPEPIEVELSVSKSGDEIIFQGFTSTVVEMECSRCLEQFRQPVSSKLQFVVQLLDDNSKHETGDDDFVVLPKTTQEYDLSMRVREVIILELPLKALCSESCRGLCSMCGVNLNESECDCAPDKTDERWDSLRQLFED